jgi:hypothetical protein
MRDSIDEAVSTGLVAVTPPTYNGVEDSARLLPGTRGGSDPRD